MPRVYTAHMILMGYLFTYSAAIVLGVLSTHDVGIVAVHVVLLALGAFALRLILPGLIDERL